MRWRASVWAMGLVILGATFGLAESPEAEEPKPIETGGVDPIAEGLRLRKILKRPSIVSGESFAPFGAEAPPPAADGPDTPLPSAPASDVLPEVQLLRDAAYQLEQTAHQLECRDLYERADQLREMAHQLRTDARRLRASDPQSSSASSQPEA